MQQIYHPGLEVIGSQWLRLHRNENLFIDDQRLREIGKSAASSLNLSRYPDPNCTDIRKKLGQIYDLDFEQIFVGNGSDEILAILLHHLRARFSEAVTPSLTYKIYPLLLQRYSYKHLTLESASENRLCIVDSPNSLTGEVTSVFDIPSAFLIWDNVYGEFANEYIDVRNRNPSTVILRSFSKCYGLANVRIGYCFADPQLVAQLMQRKDIFNVNGFAQEMALQVLEQKSYFHSLIPLIIESRKRLEEGLRSLGFLLSASQTNSVWVTHPSVSAEVLQMQLEQSWIVVRRFLDPDFCNHLRITVPPLEKVEYLLEVMRKWV